jgi:lipopolysaccharide transport system permease protein
MTTRQGRGKSGRVDQTATERTHTSIRAHAPHFRTLGQDLWHHRELLFFFAWRDVKVRYKQSIVGVGWSIIQPLSMMLVFTLFFGNVAHVSSGGIPRPIFYFAALLPWTYVQSALTNATNSLVANAPLVAKVYFPRVMLPISATLSSLVDLLIALPTLFVLEGVLLAKHLPHIALGIRLLFLPVPIVLAIATVLAMGIWLSALNARYRDVRYATVFLLQFWMFASPIVYATSAVPGRWQFLYSLNPLAGIVDGFRWSLTDTIHLSAAFPISFAAVLVGIVLSLRYFQRWEGTVADVI